MQLSVRIALSLLLQTIFCAGILVVLTTQTVAQTTAKSAAELYAEGLKLYALEDYAEAAKVFEHSYSLSEKQSTLFAWAQSERLQQHCDKASELFESYISKGEEAKQLKAAFQLIKQCVRHSDKKALALPRPPPRPVPHHDDIAAGKVRSPHQSHTPLYRRWQVYAGGSVLAIAGGSYLGLRAQSIADDASALPDGTEFSRLQRLEDQANNRALWANINFAGAGILGLTAVWMYLSASEASDTDDAISITPSVHPSEVGLTLRSSF